MKRFHMHRHVDDLARNVAFYSAMFGEQPARTEADYAKWMLQDPPLNFAISTHGSPAGIDHLGFQVDSSAELAALKARADAAALVLLDAGETTCCYARSDKYGLTDPQGLAWEQFHTLEGIPLFSAQPPESNPAPAPVCCSPPATKSVATGAPTRCC